MASENAAPMAFEVALRMRNFDELQARIATGEVISVAEKEDKYFPLAQDHDRLVAWLKAHGLEVTRTDDNRMAVFGRGSVDAVAKAFQVTFARVKASDGLEFTSAITAPSVPAEISASIVGIHGLQPHIRRRPLSTPHVVQPRLNLNGYTPAQITTAYNSAALGATGANQTIAIYALGYPIKSDLTLFWSTTSSTQVVANVANIDVAGGPGPSPATDILQEASLDVEWAGAIAPAAKIRIYGANATDPAENDEILQQVYSDALADRTLRILSISVGGNESDVPKDYLVIEAQYMANLASTGVTVLVASGDTGATAENQVQASYPTSDPDVTGVGGTTLTLTSGNAIMSETGWSGSGGGVSKVFSRPSWQVGVGVPSGPMRLVPDVASVADPSTGAFFYYNGSGAQAIGGTSWSAPTWAGFVALINQKTGTTLGFLNPKLYPLDATPAFNDILSGSNGAFSANVGYDLVTGLGSPNVSAIAAATLSSSPAAYIPAQTGNQVVTTNQLATFFVVGAGQPLPTFQWQRMASGASSWSNLSDGGNYSGTQTAMMVVSGTSSSMTGDQFQCIVTNSGGSATSNPVSLTVNTIGVTTLAGWPGSSGRANGTGRAARFANAGGLRTDSSGNVYVADSSNYAIRKVTPGGVVTTVAGIPGTMGSADGPAASATFAGIGGVAVDSSGNLFVADSGNYTIREISTSGTVSTIAGVAGSRGHVDGTGSQAMLYDPQNLAIDSSNNIYVADGKGNVVRRVTEAGAVTTIAGNGAAGSSDGTGTAASFNDPTGIAVDLSGNVYVADYGNNTVRKVTPAGAVTTMAGSVLHTGSADGTGPVASFNGPAGVGVDSSGNVYVADSGNDTVRKIDPTGFVTTVAGDAGVAEATDGLAANARFNTPGDVSVDSTGIIYVADALNSTIRRIVPGLSTVPFFTVQPTSLTVGIGSNATFAAGTAGAEPISFQWNFNGAAIAGATAPTYTVTNVQQSNAGNYTLTISNADGAATSSVATLSIGTVLTAPVITTQPASGALAGGSYTLSVTVTGGSSYTYQWLLGGVAIAGATGSSYTATAPGNYTVSITDATGTTLSSVAVVGNQGRLINISSRAIVQTGSGITIAGFVIDGAPGATKQVLIRGIGPTLSTFNITGVLAKPTITLFDSAQNVLASNTGWGTALNAAQIATITSTLGSFTLPSGSADSVILTSLAPGSYTVQMSGVGATTGIGLVEVYETNTSDPSTLVNISTRAQVGTGEDILIAGFVVSGAAPVKVLIRAVGPTLSTFGVSGALAQPVLTVFQGATAQLRISIAESLNAFALPTGSADSALVMTLIPGTYTAQVTGLNGTTGIALVEVYQAP
jgi:sugar lactone lactonase YvrE